MSSPSALPEPRTSSRGSGRSFVYLLPCRESDLVKIGYSRTPLQRFHTLHARWFDYFDLDAGALVELERVADARRLERALLVRYAARRAIAPFAVPQSAAGHTEWHAGVHDDALAHARSLCAEGGLALHAPLRGWLRAELGTRLDRLHDQPLPYMMWISQRPTDGGHWPDAWLHVEIVSPWRDAGVARFIAAAEVGAGEYFNPVLPESLAADLRRC